MKIVSLQSMGLMMTRNEAKYFVESQDMYWLKYKVVKNGVI